MFLEINFTVIAVTVCHPAVVIVTRCYCEHLLSNLLHPKVSYFLKIVIHNAMTGKGITKS